MRHLFYHVLMLLFTSEIPMHPHVSRYANVVIVRSRGFLGCVIQCDLYVAALQNKDRKVQLFLPASHDGQSRNSSIFQDKSGSPSIHANLC
jgi:hypothetical protein